MDEQAVRRARSLCRIQRCPQLQPEAVQQGQCRRSGRRRRGGGYPPGAGRDTSGGRGRHPRGAVHPSSRIRALPAPLHVGQGRRGAWVVALLSQCTLLVARCSCECGRDSHSSFSYTPRKDEVTHGDITASLQICIKVRAAGSWRALTYGHMGDLAATVHLTGTEGSRVVFGVHTDTGHVARTVERTSPVHPTSCYIQYLLSLGQILSLGQSMANLLSDHGC